MAREKKAPEPQGIPHLDVHPDVHLDVQFILVIVLGPFLNILSCRFSAEVLNAIFVGVSDFFLFFSARGRGRGV